MRLIWLAILYTAFAFTANADTLQIENLRTGYMRKLQFHAQPIAVADGSFITFAGDDANLSNYKGKVVVLNFWATWCAPCRKEMPHLSALQTAMVGTDFEVVTVATGRNEPAQMAAFLDEIGVNNLPLHRDPRQKLTRNMGVLGLPVTVILNRDGAEIARLHGDADWNSDSAKAILSALIAR